MNTFRDVRAEVFRDRDRAWAFYGQHENRNSSKNQNF